MRGWAKRKLASRRRRAAKAARYADRDAKMVEDAASKVRDGKGNPKLMKLAKSVDPEHNPPAWVADEAIWERAKKAVEPKWEEYDEPYAVVAHVYENMGGEVK